MLTIDQCEIPGREGQTILQKEAESRNHAHREWWNVLKCPYTENKAHVATTALTLNHCKQNRCNIVAGFARENTSRRCPAGRIMPGNAAPGDCEPRPAESGGRARP